MTAQDYPSWVCLNCGRKHGRGAVPGHVSTMHEGLCDVCGKREFVTEPRDFGHLRESWRDARGVSQVSDASADDGAA
jgi:5-methylcytosine-specific restriction endonuclease McrA